MLTEEDFARFKEFRCTAMGNKLREIIDDPAYDSMTFEEKVKEMIDAQVNAKVTNKIQKLNKAAGFKLADACVEEIVYLPERTLSKDRIMRLASCKWVEDHHETSSRPTAKQQARRGSARLHRFDPSVPFSVSKLK